jgi:hypothetical protein
MLAANYKMICREIRPNAPERSRPFPTDVEK